MAFVREMTGRDEMLLHATAGQVTGLLELAARVGERPDPELRALPLPNWEECLLDLRGAILGSQIEVELVCPACQAGALLIFNVADPPREVPAPPAAAPLALEPLTAGDLADLEASGHEGEQALAFLLARAARIEPEQAATCLAGDDRQALTEALETLAAGLAVELGTTCTECEAAITAPFDITDFVHTELAARATRLLDEIHLIASTYHWSESEILSLPVGRRQDYLGRIVAERALMGRLGAVA